MNIKEFLEAARQHLLGILPANQPVLASQVTRRES